MELPALIYFTSLINEGSAASAATVLGVGTSTLNHSVSALEQAMATSLLSRSPVRRGSSTLTTAHGESLYRSALHLLGWCLALVGDEGRTGVVPAEGDAPPSLPTHRLRPLLDSGLTLRMIGYFLAVCEAGRIAAAAQRLSLTQPTLSRQIRRLETILRLVEDGTCCAILPAGSFRSHAVQAVPLPARYRMTTRLIWKKDHPNLAIIDRLRAALAEIQAEGGAVGRRSVA
jgi:DNA-binding transcriptional LysR family regulator